MEYHLSNFVYPFEKDGRYYVVQTYTKRLFEIKEKVYLQVLNRDIEISSWDSRTIESFINAKILTMEDELRNLESIGEKQDVDTEWHTLHIIPTASCNFGCDYCFVLKDKKTNSCDKIISDETLYRGIDFFFWETKT